MKEAPIRNAVPGVHAERLPFVAQGGTQYPTAKSVVTYAWDASDKSWDEANKAANTPIYYRHDGALYLVRALAYNVFGANDFMEKNPGVGLLALCDCGWHVLVDMTDKGMPV